jgi:phosphoesterase RecJ-like protein
MKMNKTEDRGSRKRFGIFRELLTGVPGNVVVITHINPDGDAIGSSLGLCNTLINAGHNCSVIVPNDYPEFLKWLPTHTKAIVYKGNESMADTLIQSAAIIFFLDFNDPERITQLYESVSRSNAFIALIDHHPCPILTADYMLSDTAVSSTAELIFRFLIKAGFKNYISSAVATCLYTGIMTDTGCFSYNSSGQRTFKIVADLLGYGINKDRIFNRIYDNYSVERMRLLGHCLSQRMEYYPEYSTAMMWLNKDDLNKYNYQTGDSEGFVNYPLSIKGIRFSAFFIEKDDHIKASFRSKGNFAVNKFSAVHFNGGGHLNASGGELYETLGTTLDKFRGLLPQYKDELNNYDS